MSGGRSYEELVVELKNAHGRANGLSKQVRDLKREVRSLHIANEKLLVGIRGVDAKNKEMRSTLEFAAAQVARYEAGQSDAERKLQDTEACLKTAVDALRALTNPEGHIWHGGYFPHAPDPCTGECKAVRAAIAKYDEAPVRGSEKSEHWNRDYGNCPGCGTETHGEERSVEDGPALSDEARSVDNNPWRRIVPEADTGEELPTTAAPSDEEKEILSDGGLMKRLGQAEADVKAGRISPLEPDTDTRPRIRGKCLRCGQNTWIGEVCTDCGYDPSGEGSKTKRYAEIARERGHYLVSHTGRAPRYRCACGERFRFDTPFHTHIMEMGSIRDSDSDPRCLMGGPLARRGESE